ncbi:unnamed protein product [Ranitomeya imitator]|uniref:Uncharacterized protein n=1 Tax=Ranitomeya imitator TaxID=111125 RepID=A0ABN9LMJ8_9NEOB|nr:unnamed protein product [Ranitomeya imitator]
MTLLPSFCSYQRFDNCYCRLYKMGPEITRSIYEQFMALLHSFINAEIRELKEDGKLAVLLDSLDSLEREAGDNIELQWHPSGIPEDDERSHLVPYLLKQREYLRRLLKERSGRRTHGWRSPSWPGGRR